MDYWQRLHQNIPTTKGEVMRTEQEIRCLIQKLKEGVNTCRLPRESMPLEELEDRLLDIGHYARMLATLRWVLGEGSIILCGVTDERIKATDEVTK